jgi:hypothetical protein
MNKILTCFQRDGPQIVEIQTHVPNILWGIENPWLDGLFDFETKIFIDCNEFSLGFHPNLTGKLVPKHFIDGLRIWPTERKILNYLLSFDVPGFFLS